MMFKKMKNDKSNQIKMILKKKVLKTSMAIRLLCLTKKKKRQIKKKQRFFNHTFKADGETFDRKYNYKI